MYDAAAAGCVRRRASRSAADPGPADERGIPVARDPQTNLAHPIAANRRPRRTAPRRTWPSSASNMTHASYIGAASRRTHGGRRDDRRVYATSKFSFPIDESRRRQIPSSTRKREGPRMSSPGTSASGSNFNARRVTGHGELHAALLFFFCDNTGDAAQLASSARAEAARSRRAPMLSPAPAGWRGRATSSRRRARLRRLQMARDEEQ